MEEDDEEIPELVAFEEAAKIQKVPVTLVTGFLGAGKSTLLKHLLTQPHGKKIAIIENEFAQGLGIESAIIKDGTDGTSLDGIIELSNGCICCSVKSDLVATLEQLIERRAKFDYIIIEASGMAHPGPIASALWLDEQLESQVQLDGVVTVVDAKHIRKQLGQHGDHGEEALQQLLFADRVLVNKTDLISEEEALTLETLVMSLNRVAKIQRTHMSKVDVDFVLGIGGYESKTFGELEGGETSCCDNNHHNHDHDDHIHEVGVTTQVLVEEGAVDEAKVRRWLADLLWQEQEDEGGKEGDRAMQIYRMKGLMAVAGYDNPHILQVVYDTFDITSSQMGWPQGRKSCRLVVIGKFLDEARLAQGFHSCLV